MTGELVDIRKVMAEVSAAVVGREREIELVLAAVTAGRHVLLEGAPGTGKSTLLRSLAAALQTDLVFVEGNAELTPARLAGQFDPARVLSDGYIADAFVPGPLVNALQQGSLLYVEELNRVPEETVNLLIGVMSEAELHLPRVGRIKAAPGFRFVAAMNPYDNVGTARVAAAVYDRICRVAMDYQDEACEREITRRNLLTLHSAACSTSAADAASARDFTHGSIRDLNLMVNRAVKVTRATRSHDDVRMGSSVRGAIDLVEIADRLARMRNRSIGEPNVGLDAALTALSGRVQLHPGARHTAEEIVTELWNAVLARETTQPGDGSSSDQQSGRERHEPSPRAGKDRAPAGATSR